MPGEGIFLLAEDETFVLEGADALSVVPLLDGRRTQEIIAALGPGSAPNVMRVLRTLQEHGHLVERDLSMPASAAAFWDSLGTTPTMARKLLGCFDVSVTSLCDTPPEPLVSALSQFGIAVRESAAASIVLLDDYLDPRLPTLNAECQRRRRPWLPVKVRGARNWFGPLFVPGRTGCWECLATRLRGNREVESYVSRKTGVATFPNQCEVPLISFQTYVLVATQLVRWIVTGASWLESYLTVVDPLNVNCEKHFVTRLPQCTRCGDPSTALVAGRPIVLRPIKGGNSSESGIRATGPEETFAKYRHLISTLTGVVSEIAPSPWHGVGPIRTFFAGHNFALKNDSLWFLKDGLRNHSSGKGKTNEQARTSALCEAIERHSGIFRGDEPHTLAAFSDISADAVDPRNCMLFSQHQYANRQEWLARNSRFQVVPREFDPERPIDWTPLWSLTNGARRLLPTSYLYYNYPYNDETFYCWADSNGCAAGTTKEDAILQGALELVERDAVALWWYNRIKMPSVDLDALDDGFVQSVTDFCRGVGRAFWVLDLTNDLDIPVFAALSARTDGPTEDIMLGFGAHLDPAIALTRAVTEMNQFLPAVLSRTSDGRTLYGFRDHDAINWWTTATLENQPYLRAREKVLLSNPRVDCSNIKVSVDSIVDTLRSKSIEVLVLDQTRPDIGLDVVKVVAPGLRHFWARFAPGRLYDAPVQSGWVAEATSEAQLNPVPMFL